MKKRVISFVSVMMVLALVISLVSNKTEAKAAFGKEKSVTVKVIDADGNVIPKSSVAFQGYEWKGGLFGLLGKYVAKGSPETIIVKDDGIATWNYHAIGFGDSWGLDKVEWTVVYKNHSFTGSTGYISDTLTDNNISVTVQFSDHRTEVISEQAATCEAGGFTQYGCTVCGNTDRVPVDALGHAYGEPSITEANCENAKKTTYICSRENCGKEKVETEETALGHAMNAGVIIAEASYTSDGAIRFSCTRTGCTHYYDQPVPMLSHTFSETGEEHEATCTTPAYTVYACTEEGCTVTNTVYHGEALGHDATGEVKHENEIAATCTKGGSYDEVLYCNRENCSAELSRNTVDTDALGHDATGEVKIENEIAATCLAGGSYDKVLYCNRENCNSEISRKYVPTDALGHDYQVIDHKASTVSEAGYTTYQCSRCYDEYTDELDLIVAPVNYVDLSDLPTVIDPSLLPVEVSEEAEEIQVEAPETPEGGLTDDANDTAEEPSTEEPEVTEIPEVTPEAGEETEEIELDDTTVPEGEAEENLPKTGTAPIGVFYGIGSACVVFGAVAVGVTRKKKRA